MATGRKKGSTAKGKKRAGYKSMERRSPTSGQDGQAATLRWTEKIITKGWTPVSSYFLANYHRLRPDPPTHGEAMLVIHLIAFKSESDAPFPALGGIATQMGVGSQQVRKLARSLDAKGLLRRQFRKGERSQYYFAGLFHRLEVLIDEDEAADRKKARMGAMKGDRKRGVSEAGLRR